MVYSDDPTYGASLDLIQQSTGASLTTARRWKAKPDTIPTSAARLIRFAVHGDCAELFGQQWQGFYFQNDRLHIPLHKRGFDPLHIAAMFFEVQELRHLRRVNHQLEAELKKAQGDAWANQKIREISKIQTVTR